MSTSFFLAEREAFRRETMGGRVMLVASSVSSRNQDQDGDWSRTALVLVPAAMFDVDVVVVAIGRIVGVAIHRFTADH